MIAEQNTKALADEIAEMLNKEFQTDVWVGEAVFNLSWAIEIRHKTLHSVGVTVSVRENEGKVETHHCCAYYQPHYDLELTCSSLNAVAVVYDLKQQLQGVIENASRDLKAL